MMPPDPAGPQSKSRNEGGSARRPVESYRMKWRNIEAGGGYYYITGTVAEWLSLLSRDDLRRAVCHEIKIALARFSASLAAYVIMPNHLHVLVHLPKDGDLHRFCKCWRGRSARRIIDLLLRGSDHEALDIFGRHANGRCKYASWKEQVRALYITKEATLLQKVNYIDGNPVRRGLAAEPGDWPYSSFNWYEGGREDILPLVIPEV